MVIIEANKEKSNAIVPENITIMARSIHEVTKQDFSAIVSELTGPNAESYLEKTEAEIKLIMNASQTILDVLENPEFANEKLATAKYSLDGTAFHDTLSILENPTEKALFVKTLTNKMTATEQACAQILKTLISPIQTPSIVQGGMGVVHPGIGANQEEGGPDTEYVSQDKE